MHEMRVRGPVARSRRRPAVVAALTAALTVALATMSPATAGSGPAPVPVPATDRNDGDAHPARGRRAIQPDTLAALGARIRQVLDDRDIAGAGISLVTADSILWTGTFGVADRASARPVTATTRFRLGSIAKSIVALGIMRLVEEGRMDLQAPIGDIAPEITIDNPWRMSHPVRLVHVLEHTSGFEDAHFREVYNLDADPTIPLRDVLSLCPATRTVRWRPGTHVSYSNHGYTVAGHLLERVTGESFESHLERTILRPAGMTSSGFVSAEGDASGYLASGEALPLVPLYQRPASAFVSTPIDMARLARLLLNRGALDGRTIIDELSLARMERATSGLTARAGFENGYGLGLRSRAWHGYRYVGHGGGLPDFTSEFGYLPELGVGFVVMINSGDTVAFHRILREVLGVIVPEPGIPEPGASIPASRLARYAGHYEYCNPERRVDAPLNILLAGVTVTCRGASLYRQEFGGPETSLIPVTETIFRTADEEVPSIVFLSDDRGRAVMAEPMARAEWVRVGAWRPTLYRALCVVTVLLMVSIVLHGIFWVPATLARGVQRRLRSAPGAACPADLSTGGAPASRGIVLGAVLALIGTGIALQRWARDPVHVDSPAAVVVFATTLLFAILSVAGLISSVIALRRTGSWVGRRGHAGRASRVYYAVVSAACVGAMAFLAHWGLIGLRLWAY